MKNREHNYLTKEWTFNVLPFLPPSMLPSFFFITKFFKENRPFLTSAYDVLQRCYRCKNPTASAIVNTLKDIQRIGDLDLASVSWKTYLQLATILTVSA